MWIRRRAAALLTALTLAACTRNTPPAPSPRATPPRPFTVAAAADLQAAFTEIGREFGARTGTSVVFSFGSTGSLAKQIENGAPIDLFAAANEAFVEELRQEGLTVPDTQQRYATGRIVLASSKAAGVNLQDLMELENPQIQRVAIANPDHAPYGMAARETLVSAGLWDKVQPKLVFAENIRQTLQFIQTGNAEAGFVALSIARTPEITYILVDDRLHKPLHQALAVVKGSPNERIAREFAAFLRGPVGKPIMERYGFVVPASP